MMTTGQVNGLLRRVEKKLDGLLKDMYKESVYTKFMNVSGTQKYIETVQAYDNMRASQRIPEAAPYPDMDFRAGYSQKYQQNKFGARFSITKEIRQFDRTDIIGMGGKHLRLGTYKAKEIIGNDFLVYGNLAITSVPLIGGAPLINTIGGDGNPLFYQTHTFRSTGGVTWSNINGPSNGSSYDDITEEGLNTMFVAVSTWTDNTGAPLAIKLQNIIHPPELTQKVYKLTKSVLQPGDNNNAVNSIPILLAGNKSPIANPWISAATLGNALDWYGMTDADQESFGLQWFVGWDDDVKTGNDDVNQNNFIAIDFSCATGANELRTLYKSAST